MSPEVHNSVNSASTGSAVRCSGVIVDGKLYAAHANYPAGPMAYSIEMFRTWFHADTLQHLSTHSFGI